MTGAILGPHRYGDSLSTTAYFNFYAERLPPLVTNIGIVARCPGGVKSDEWPARTLKRQRWENFVEWPVYLTRIHTDFVHIVDQGLAWYATFLRRGRRLITVHDLIAYMAWKGLLDLRALSRRKQALVWECIRQVKRADHLVTVSQCTADHLMTLLAIPASKISVVPNVLEESFAPIASSSYPSIRTRWFGNAEFVVIHVGKPSAYKNRIGALRAFCELHRRLPGARMFLVHGAPDAEESALVSESSITHAVHFLPLITRSELREFYGAADVLIFPSLYEGFGWPPLEAMACGCPVVCTTRGSLREVATGAALTLDNPYGYVSMAEAMKTVLLDRHMAEDLRQSGFRRAAKYAPNRILAQMANIYRAM